MSTGSGKRDAACLLLIILAGFWAYSNSFNGVFVLDDLRGIVQNETIRSLTPIAQPLSPPPKSTVSGRPLANLTFAVNYAISGVDVRGYHILNLLIHLGCALTLFGVVRRTLRAAPVAAIFGPDATYVAAAAALIWVVHPLTTAAVTYIVQRVESLMSLFYLLTLYCAIRAAQSARRALWTAASIAACALGMATKEVMVTAPLAVALWDVVFRRNEGARWGLLAGLAATWLVFATLVSGEQREASIAMSGSMSWRYLMTQAEVLTQYLRLAFVPSPLVFLYTWPLVSSPTDVILEGLLILTGLVLTALAVWKRRPLGYAGAIFFLILAPTSSIIPIVTEVAAEHRMYLPLAAMVTAVVAVGYVASQRVTPRLARSAAVASVAVVVLLLGAMTRSRNVAYASEQRLWADTVAKDPDNPRARVAYGSVLAQSGEVNAAEPQFRRAVELNGADAIAHARLGSVLAAQGKIDDAVVHLKESLAINQADVDAHRMLGQIFAMQRKDADAIVHLERALEAQPDNPQLVVQVASVRADSRDPSVRNLDRAVALAERGVELTERREATALDVLGLAYARQGRFAEAVSAAQDALAIARASGNTAAAQSIESRLRAYEAQLK
jgi:tetratricopeptide (TPR) repeat protein